MASDITKSLNRPQPNQIANFTLAIDFRFKRALPAEAITSTRTILKDLDYTNYYDCMTGKEITNLVFLDCETSKWDADGLLK